jgi:hypothetical protein
MCHHGCPLTEKATWDQPIAKWAQKVAAQPHLGQSVPLWCQIDQGLVGTLLGRWQRVKRLHYVALAKIHGGRPRGGRLIVLFRGNVTAMSQNRPLYTINTPLMLHIATHTSISEIQLAKL